MNIGVSVHLKYCKTILHISASPQPGVHRENDSVVRLQRTSHGGLEIQEIYTSAEETGRGIAVVE